MNIVKKANARMELVRKVASFGASQDDLKNIYFLFVRSLLEQSATVWHSSLTRENSDDLERVQKSAIKVILGNEYKSYNESLLKLDMESLEDRRETLCLKFVSRSQDRASAKTKSWLTRVPQIIEAAHQLYGAQQTESQ